MPPSNFITLNIILLNTISLQTEKQLIKNCQKGVKASQYELVKRYSGMLMAVCRRYVRDEATAKDILQDSLILIFGNIGKYKPTGSFEGWMRTITVRCALSWLRKNSRTLNVIDPTAVESVISFDPKIYGQLGADDIIELIQKLPPGYRSVFNLYAIEGYSHKEIGELLNTTEGASRSQFSRAKKALQKHLISLNQVKKSNSI